MATAPSVEVQLEPHVHTRRMLAQLSQDASTVAVRNGVWSAELDDDVAVLLGSSSYTAAPRTLAVH